VAYVRGAKAGTARSKPGAFKIVDVLVVGVDRTDCSGQAQRERPREANRR
jgi:hypothetical protein